MPKSKPVKKIPNPGSYEAQKLGCHCPVMDNHNGLGYQGRKNVFIVNAGCIVHSNKEKGNENVNSKK